MKTPETQQQKDAFEAYWNLGKDRTIAKLHQHFTNTSPEGITVVTDRTLKEWSRKFNWQERILLRSKKIALGVEEKVVNEEINIRADSLKNMRQAVDISRSALASAYFKDVDGKVKLKPEIRINTINDLVKVTSDIVKGELAIQNLIEPAGSAKQIIEVKWQTKEE